ncbi:hypothetical protein [Sporomusa sphaeroides]|uniref:Uncharacterized protein n=1 Tax=uncultured Sporomusa sp. TaxID=307249 RepID=A0A212LWC9_9FIRM|nr:hypothetical protein [Sporomusa sphaeroides]SCM81924.1 conserved hypothetical protein [uncultured Sporomusa sp.]HML32776.1 hypothetical protein [Sporomusa sphaeroides]
MKSHNIAPACPELNPEQLEKKAKRLAKSHNVTIAAGNAVVLFTMFVLEEILEQLLLDPITNLTSILALADIIANLNASINLDP